MPVLFKWNVKIGYFRTKKVKIGKIKDLSDVMASPATYARNATIKLNVSGLGPVTFPGTPLCFSDDELGFEPAPELGQHNKEIYCDLLGHSETELAQLLENQDI